MTKLRPGSYIRRYINRRFETIKEAVEYCNKNNIDIENIIPMFGIKEGLKFGVIEEDFFSVESEIE